VTSFGNALRSLLESARLSPAATKTPGDRWLILRIEEALRGFDEIQEITSGETREAPTYGATVGAASILARRAGALG
jgi:hypothetical protein